MAGKDKDEKILEEALELFKQANDSEQENRDQFIEDVEFCRLGKQWPDKVKEQRDREGRPCLTFNRMPSFLRQVVNDARMNRPAIIVHPSGDGSDKETAEILNGLIRNIEQSSNADVAYDTAIDFSVSGGIGYFRISTDYACEDSFDLDIQIERISNPLTVWGDHRSTAADSSDWDYAFITELLSEDEFERRYPKAEKTSFEADNDQRDQNWFQDDCIRVAEYWVREEVEKTVYLLSDGSVMDADGYMKAADILEVQGIAIKDQRITKSHKVTQHIMTGAEILETNDWPGKYIPIVPVYGDEVWVDGKRYWQSLIHHAKDAQVSYNYWRTSAVEKVALDTKSPWIGPRGAFKTDAEKWASANVRNHPFIEYDGNVSPARTPAGGVPAGDLQMAMNASDDMKSIMGIYDASLGARSNETSGRAIIARQREGDVSTFHFIDNLSRAIRHAGRIIINLIPKIYNTPRIIRTLKEDGTPGMIPVNQEALINGMPRVFDLTAGKYDVTVKSGPSFSTKREEAAEQMIEFVRAFPAVTPVIGDLLVKNLDWPGAEEIAKRLQAMLPPQMQGQNPVVAQAQQQIQAMQMQLGQATQQINVMQQQLANKQADEQIKAMQAQNDAAADAARIELDRQKVSIDQYKAETDRLKLELEAQGQALAQSPQQSIDLAPITDALAALQQNMQAMQMMRSEPIVFPYGGSKRKQAKAVKQSDGSWLMEAIEQEIPDQGEC